MTRGVHASLSAPQLILWDLEVDDEANLSVVTLISDCGNSNLGAYENSFYSFNVKLSSGGLYDMFV